MILYTRNFCQLRTQTFLQRFYSIYNPNTAQKKPRLNSHKVSGSFAQSSTLTHTHTQNSRNAKNSAQLVIWIWNENYENLRDEVTTAHAGKMTQLFYNFTRFIYDYYPLSSKPGFTFYYALEHLEWELILNLSRCRERCLHQNTRKWIPFGMTHNFDGCLENWAALYTS